MLMIQEWEIWACANHYIKLHGDDAAIVAAMRADELMDQGDLEGARVFRRIVNAVNELSKDPAGSVH